MNGDGNAEQRHASLVLEDGISKPKAMRPTPPSRLMLGACPPLLLAMIGTAVFVLNGKGMKSEVVKYTWY